MTVQTHKHRLMPLCFSWTEATEDNTPQRLPLRWNTTWNGNRAAEPVGVFDSSTEQPPAIFFLFPRYLLHLPHMSDNIKTCCSSKVSLIKSTHISADKTANVKMVKKQTFLSIALILYAEWWTEDALLIDAGHYGIWGLCLYSILSPLQY